jgi:hypothetical protein
MNALGSLSFEQDRDSGLPVKEKAGLIMGTRRPVAPGRTGTGSDQDTLL